MYQLYPHRLIVHMVSYTVVHWLKNKKVRSFVTVLGGFVNLNRLSAVSPSLFPLGQMSENVPSDPPYEAMASPSEGHDGDSEAPSTIHYPPSERSRSEYGRTSTVAVADTVVRQPPVPMVLTRGFNPNASREGMPASSSVDPTSRGRGSGSQQTFVQNNSNENHFNQLNVANTVLVANQDPAITSLIEATAELRHGEHIAEIKSEAQRIHDDRLQAVRVQAEEQHEKKISELVGILQERMHTEEARVWERAEVMERHSQLRLQEQSEEHRMVLDRNLGQMTASKDNQLEQIKREFSAQSSKKDVRISELENLVRLQSEQIAAQQRNAEDLNWRMNQLLANPAMGIAPPPLETGTMTTPCITKTTSQLSPEAKTFHPQAWNSSGQDVGEADDWPLNTAGQPLGTATFPAAAAALAFVPSLIPPISPEHSLDWSHITGVNDHHDTPVPTPTEIIPPNAYATSGGGGGGDPPGNGNGNGGNGRGPPSPPGGGGPPGLPGGGGSGNGGNGGGGGNGNGGRPGRGNDGGGPPDGGAGDGDPDDFHDDEDERFIRRMRRIFGGLSAPDTTSEQGKIKEADTIKLPAFPAAETYRNW